VSYINISGTFYYLCSILDGCSRYIVNWDVRESMTEADIEVILDPRTPIRTASPIVSSSLSLSPYVFSH
jgi:transposase InsO family protein